MFNERMTCTEPDANLEGITSAYLTLQIFLFPLGGHLRCSLSTRLAFKIKLFLPIRLQKQVTVLPGRMYGQLVFEKKWFVPCMPRCNDLQIKVG